jgi:hypothetical protein
MPPLMTKRQLKEFMGTPTRVSELLRKIGVNQTIEVRGTVRFLRPDIAELLRQHRETTACQR